MPALIAELSKMLIAPSLKLPGLCTVLVNLRSSGTLPASTELGHQNARPDAALLGVIPPDRVLNDFGIEMSKLVRVVHTPSSQLIQGCCYVNCRRS